MLVFQNISANKYTGGGFSSLVSWIGYGSGGDTVSIPTSLLPRNSTTITHSPYFAFFALHLEEYCTQTETGLWKETLSILASVAGKANVDNAVKVFVVMFRYIKRLALFPSTVISNIIQF